MISFGVKNQIIVSMCRDWGGDWDLALRSCVCRCLALCDHSDGGQCDQSQASVTSSAGLTGRHLV